MRAISHLEPLLSGRPIVLWVEDRLTREYLQRIWQPDDQWFQILIAGSRESVISVVHDLQGSGHGHVFGLIDRDFGDSNRSRWQAPSSEIFIYRPQRLEMENYLLDEAALAGCGENINRYHRTQNDIQARASQYAERSLWWMACRQVLSHYHEKLVGRFPRHPLVDGIQSLEQAKAYIQTRRNWWPELPDNVAHMMDSENITTDLQAAHSRYQEFLSQGRWSEHFSGKEIFRRIRGYLFNQNYARPEVMDTDLAKSVADWQLANGSVPDELLELKDAILRRVGLP